MLEERSTRTNTVGVFGTKLRVACWQPMAATGSPRSSPFRPVPSPRIEGGPLGAWPLPGVLPPLSTGAPEPAAAAPPPDRAGATVVVFPSPLAPQLHTAKRKAGAREHRAKPSPNRKKDHEDRLRIDRSHYTPSRSV